MAVGKKTGGRQKGTPNKATVERNLRAAKGLRAATLDGLLPLDVMMARMKNEALPNGTMVADDQLEAAIAAAPYIHPKLAAAVFKEIPEAEGPIVHKLALDYSLLEPDELVTLRRLIIKATPKQDDPLMIEGDAALPPG